LPARSEAAFADVSAGATKVVTGKVDGRRADVAGEMRAFLFVWSDVKKGNNGNNVHLSLQSHLEQKMFFQLSSSSSCVCSY